MSAAALPATLRPAGAAPGVSAAAAVARMSAIELWERYSYNTLLILLPLFLIAPHAKGGFGWPEAPALVFFGSYSALTAVAMVPGGYIVDRWMGGVLATRAGMGMMLAGYALLGALYLIPGLIEQASGEPVRDILLRSPRPLGVVGGADPHWPLAARHADAAMTSAFYLALTLIGIGNAVFKPVLTVAVGRLPHRDPVERDSAFTTFFTFINFGGLLGTVIGGAIAEVLSWSWTFASTAVAMAVALGLLLVFAPRYIDPFLPRPAPAPPPADPAQAEPGQADPAQADPAQADPARVRAPHLPWAPVALLLACAVAAGVTVFQSYGLISLFTAAHVDRVMFGVTVPPAWFISLNPLYMLFLAPLLRWTWVRRGPGWNWSPTRKIGAGFVCLALTFLLATVAVLQARGGALAHPLWIVASLLAGSLAELLITPVGLAAISRLAPPHRHNLAVAGWIGAFGFGSWLSGHVGALAVEHGIAPALVILAAAATAIGATLWALSRRLATLGL